MQTTHIALSQLEISVHKSSMCLAPSKYKVLLQGCWESVPALTLAGEPPEFVDKFVYVGSCVSAGRGVTDEISNCIMNARVVNANLSHLWRHHDVKLAAKGRVYNVSVDSVFLYACEKRPLRAEGVGRLCIFDRLCFRRIVGLRRHHSVSNPEIW
uniref:Uncharacterized protein n=1 Tax=Trichobilharzia regenti TaxID=157069 RepID=A0AA85KC79_TRIRE|nr:unnamed protein product [Trichobilharzia regenti]